MCNVLNTSLPLHVREFHNACSESKKRKDVSEYLQTVFQSNWQEILNRPLNELTALFYHTRKNNKSTNRWTGRCTDTHTTQGERHSTVIGQMVVLIREEFQYIRKMSVLSVLVAAGFQ